MLLGIRCQNCTRTNRQAKVCSKPCDPARDNCKGSRHCLCDGDCGYSCVKRGKKFFSTYVCNRFQVTLFEIYHSHLFCLCRYGYLSTKHQYSRNTYYLVLQFTKWKGWTQFWSTASMDKEIFPSAVRALCMASFPFSACLLRLKFG